MINRNYHAAPLNLVAALFEGEIRNRSLTASLRLCLDPMYRSVVYTDACPRRNWICSSSPPASWRKRTQVRQRSSGPDVECPANFVPV